MVCSEAAIGQQWAYPTHAMVTVVMVVLFSSLKQQPQRGAGEHIYSIVVWAALMDIAGLFLGQGMSPLLIHTVKPLSCNQIVGVALAVPANGL